MTRWFLLLALLLGMASPALAADCTAPDANYKFVATTGNDTTGTGATGSPWRTIRKGVESLSAGKTLCIRGGTYTSASDVVDTQAYTVPSGNNTGWGTTYSGAVTIMAYPGETVTLKPPANAEVMRFTYANVSYVVVKNLILDMSNQTEPPVDPGTGYVFDRPAAIYVACCSSYLLFDGLDIGYTMTHAIQWSTNGDSDGKYDAHLTLQNSRIHDAGRSNGPGRGGNGINNGYGIYTFSSYNVLLDNEWVDNYASAINFYGDNGTIRGNRIHDNGWQRPNGPYSGINICSDAYYHPTTYEQYPCTNILISNNTVYSNSTVSGSGVQIYTHAQTVKLYNNTIDGNQNFGVNLQYCNSVEVKNNIIRGNGTNWRDEALDACAITCSYNLVPSSTPSGCTNGVTSSPVYTGTGNFLLVTGSAGINQGTTLADVPTDITGATRPAGVAYDIGAYETGATGTAVTITTTLLINGTKTVSYTQSAVATGGSGTFNACSVSAGALPTGLSVSIVSNECAISGTPSVAGKFAFTLQVCDNAGSPVCDTQAYSVSIADICSSSTSGSWTILGCPGESSITGSANATSHPITTTGADLAVCAVASDVSGTAPTFSDSKANSWTLTTTKTGTYGRVQVYYSRLTSVGVSHTFTVNTGGLNTYPTFLCGVFSGSLAAPSDAFASSSATASTSFAAGTILTSEAQQLVVQVLEIETTSITSVALGDSYTLYQRATTDTAFGIAFGWKTFATAATSTSPSWSWTPSADSASASASYLSVVAPDATPHLSPRLRLRIQR